MESRTAASNPAPYESPLLTSLRHDRTSFFSQLPRDITRLISSYVDADNEIDLALRHAADARQEHVDALIAMVSAKPHLLLQRGRVITPGGHDVRGVTLYEYCLGAGDPELASKIQPYFARITGIDGEAKRDAQYERYKPYIDSMMTQNPYDLKPLIMIIKNASAADVTAMLNKDMTHNCALRDAMVQFRKDHAPRIITKPCMHFNYRSLLHALKLLDHEWGHLYRADGKDYNKIRLVWRQLIGFEMRRLPGIDRCRLACGLSNKHFERTYKYRYKDDADDFPVTLTDISLDGLGGDFSVDIFYGLGEIPRQALWVPKENLTEITNFISSKYNSLLKLMPRPEQTTGCVIS